MLVGPAGTVEVVDGPGPYCREDSVSMQYDFVTNWILDLSVLTPGTLGPDETGLLGVELVVDGFGP